MIRITLHILCDGPLERATHDHGCDKSFDCQVPFDFTGRIESGGSVDINPPEPRFNDLPEGWTHDYRGTLCPDCSKRRAKYEQTLAAKLSRPRRKP